MNARNSIIQDLVSLTVLQIVEDIMTDNTAKIESLLYSLPKEAYTIMLNYISQNRLHDYMNENQSPVLDNLPF